MGIFSLLLAALAYGLFYANSPGRHFEQTLLSGKWVKPVAVVLLVLSIVLASLAYSIGTGTVLVLVVIMTIGSILAIFTPAWFAFGAKGLWLKPVYKDKNPKGHNEA